MSCDTRRFASDILWFASPRTLVAPSCLLREVEGRATVTLKPGDVLFIPAGTIHAAKAVGSARGVEVATYIVEKGKPLLTLIN